MSLFNVCIFFRLMVQIQDREAWLDDAIVAPKGIG